MLLLVVVGFCLSATASSVVLKPYHDAVGIPLAASIKAIEDASRSKVLMTENKIVGGAVAPVSAHPYLVSTSIKDDSFSI